MPVGSEMSAPDLSVQADIGRLQKTEPKLQGTPYINVHHISGLVLTIGHPGGFSLANFGKFQLGTAIEVTAQPSVAGNWAMRGL